jgi:hypothetical protein
MNAAEVGEGQAGTSVAGRAAGTVDRTWHACRLAWWPGTDRVVGGHSAGFGFLRPREGHRSDDAHIAADAQRPIGGITTISTERKSSISLSLVGKRRCAGVASNSYFASTNSCLSDGRRELWRHRKPPACPGPLHANTCSEKGRSPGRPSRLVTGRNGSG